MRGNLGLITLSIYHSKLAQRNHNKRTKVTKVAFDVRFGLAFMGRLPPKMLAWG